MDDKLYITDSLYYKKNKLYHEFLDNNIVPPIVKITIINNLNWHKYLKDYGWEKLPLGWRKRLKTKDKNFRYGMLDCGSQGDCLFHSIAEALNDNTSLDNIIYCVENLREFTASMINANNFDMIIENYRCEKIDGCFDQLWDPFSIETIEDLKNEICKGGDGFWGDHVLLQLLQEKLKFNTIILNSGEFDENYSIHPLGNSIDKHEKTIVLYYDEGLHFKLVGYFNKNKMRTVFKRNELPEKLLEIYNIDCHIEK